MNSLDGSEETDAIEAYEVDSIINLLSKALELPNNTSLDEMIKIIAELHQAEKSHTKEFDDLKYDIFEKESSGTNENQSTVSVLLGLTDDDIKKYSC